MNSSQDYTCVSGVSVPYCTFVADAARRRHLAVGQLHLTLSIVLYYRWWRQTCCKPHESVTLPLDSWDLDRDIWLQMLAFMSRPGAGPWHWQTAQHESKIFVSRQTSQLFSLKSKISVLRCQKWDLDRLTVWYYLIILSQFSTPRTLISHKSQRLYHPVINHWYYSFFNSNFSRLCCRCYICDCVLQTMCEL